MKRLFFTFFAVMAMLFTAHAQSPAGYVIYGAQKNGYTDLTKAAAEAQGSVTFLENILTGSGLPGRINETGNYLRISLGEATAMSLTENFALHVVLKKKTGATNKVQISLCNNGWNAARVSWEIENSLIGDDDFSNIALKYSARNTGNYNSYGEINIVGDKTFSGEILRICAAASEQFEISQIYIKVNESTPDPVDPNECTDEDAPTGLTLAASNIQDKSVTLTASANDAASSISYEFFYKAEGDAEFTPAGTASAASNTDATKEVKGLAPETNYTFKVVATDPCNNEAEFVKTEEVQTLAFIERRYYFFRGDPASVSLPSEGVVSYDLREGVGTTVGNGGGFSHSQKKYYTNFANSNNSSWWSFNQDLSPARDMSEITQADWYLVVKFRTTITDNRFNIRLFDAGACWQVNHIDAENHKGELSIDQAGNWNTLTLPLSSAMQTLNNSKSRVFQFHSDGGSGYLDIAYAYLTNNAASVDDLADNVAPAISSVVDGDKTTSSAVLTVTASDDSGEDITYIVKEAETVLTSTPASGASGAVTAITVSGLTGTDHTLTVIARDAAGNEASKNKAITLPAAVTPPSNLVVTTTHTYKSVTFTMAADDSNASLVYAILDANNSDAVLAGNIAGTAGENTVYTLKGLTPETAYSFKVQVTNAASLSATSEVINITTNALSEHRFYLTRGDNTGALPSGANLTSTYVDCNVEFGNSSRDNRASDYISAKTGNTWIAITLKPKATVENEIDDDWYIVVRFRSNLSNNVFGFNNFRLNLSNNAENWYINNSDDDKPFGHDYNDGQWVVLKKRLDSRRAGSAIPASYLTANQIAVQLHVKANLVAGEFLDIDYIYFTDDITSVDEGTQSLRRVVLKDNADNSAVLSAHNGETVDADLVRTLSSASYNSFCLPFNMSAAQVEEAFGAGAKIGRLNNAAIEGDELLLGFGFVNSIEAGVPYLIQPEGDVINPFVENVTLANTEKPAVFNDVRFIGVLNPTEIAAESQENHFVLLLGSNNELTWANTTANMRGMRAYFKTGSTVSKVVRRARFNFEGEQVATGLDEVQRDNAQCTKVIRDGQLYILHNGAMYNVQGVRVQ